MIVSPNTGRILLPDVCKVCHSRIGWKNVWICCSGTRFFLDLWRVECI